MVSIEVKANNKRGIKAFLNSIKIYLLTIIKNFKISKYI